MVGPTTPVVVAYWVPRLLVYFTESAKYASSAVIRFRKSDFIDARYAFSFVFANFGIAIAARIPMITTTIRSSIRVKPFLFTCATSGNWDTVTRCSVWTRPEAIPSRLRTRVSSRRGLNVMQQEFRSRGIASHACSVRLVPIRAGALWARGVGPHEQ